MANTASTEVTLKAWKWGRVKMVLGGHAAMTFAVLAGFGGLWYWREPKADVVPLVVYGGVVGYFLGRATNRELLEQKDREIERRDTEITRMADHKVKLESKLLAQRQSSVGGRRRKRGER